MEGLSMMKSLAFLLVALAVPTGAGAPKKARSSVEAAGPIDVRDFGAAGDGARDDAPAWQAAIDALPESGGRVRVRCGTYRFGSPVAFTKGGVVIEGEGGSGWNTGSCVRVETVGAIVAFRAGIETAQMPRGPSFIGISVRDTTGDGVGAFRIVNQWNAMFRDVAVNGFVRGYAFSLEGTGGPLHTQRTRLEGVEVRSCRFGLRSSGLVTATFVLPGTYFALGTDYGDKRGTIGVQLAGTGKFFGSVDGYETGVKLVGDGHHVSGRLEGNALHVHIAGPTARRNIISGTSFLSGGTIASVQIDAGEGIYNNVVALNTYAAPAVGIVDNSAPGRSSFVFEPGIDTATGDQQGRMVLRRATVAGALTTYELRNLTKKGNGTGAGFLATAGDGVAQGTLRAKVESPRPIVELGSTTETDVALVRGSAQRARLTETGFAFGEAGGAPVTGHLSGTAVLDFPSTYTGNGSDLAIPVPGAADGDTVTIAIPAAAMAAVAGAAGFYAWVSSPGAVTVRFWNASGGARDPRPGSFRADVWKH